MLTELKLSNFRIFDDEVTVRFRPITILIGKNSSGKSSIIKFLLMLQQSSVPGQSRFLNPEGDKVNLGAFGSLKNALTTKRDLTFELSANAAGTGIDIAPVVESLQEADDRDLRYKASAKVSYSRRVSRGRARYSIVDVSSGESFLGFTTRALEDSSFWDYPPIPHELDSSSRPKKQGALHGNIRNNLKLLAQMAMNRSIVDALRYQISSTRHLLPVRVESQRVILASFPPMDNVGQRGEYTLPHLQQLSSRSSGEYEFIRPHLENIANIEAIRFRISSGNISQAYARNKTTGADVLIADYGFGVGQCLPILVQGAIMSPYTSLMVEQPEAQLHPTAQLELGSFFADLWKLRNVGSIIESHSGNLLLRLRRLIATEELSPEDVSVAFLDFDDSNAYMPTVKNLDIERDGSMQTGLPMEFFGADIIEGLQLRARA